MQKKKNSRTPAKAKKKVTAKKGKKRRRVLTVGQIDVIGRRPSKLEGVPGSAEVLDKKKLKRMTPANANEALRQLPGVNAVGEDGMGLRLNIGIRGLDPVRGRKVLVLEDGVPIALAPYGEPDLYYTPAIERMQRLELVKGSGSILWGPRTIGGVLNFITHDPPKELQVKADARFGNYGFFVAQASVGDTIGGFGYLLNVLHKRFTGPTQPSSLDLSLVDITSKFRIQLSPRAILGIKLQFYDELSRATYLGMTTPQFLQDPTQNHAIFDRFPVRRYGLSATHKYVIGESGMLQTTLYAHQVSRFWQRQDYDRSGSRGDYERIIDSSGKLNPNAPADGGSIFFRNSTGNRNRAFTIVGLGTRYSLEFSTGKVDHELLLGARVHHEIARERYIIGENAASRTGFIRDDETRRLSAIAAHVQYSLMFLNRRLRIIPGFRIEGMFGGRHLYRTRVKQPDGSRAAQDTNIIEDSVMWAPIPGMGLSYTVTKGLTLFGGVHRGFAPPRVRDSITADGDDLELDPEFSWNYELGFRWFRKNYLAFQFAGFAMDFQNQVIPPSESSGAVANDPDNQGKSKINGGETFHAGLEASVTFDLPAMYSASFRVPLQVSYTFVPIARFASGRFSGNRLPYAPEHMLTASLAFIHKLGFSLGVSTTFVSEQFTDKGNTVTSSLNGLVGQIEQRVIFDANARYTFRRGKYSLSAYITGKNLGNSVYITSRRPQGIRVGMFRQVIGGIQGSF